MLIEQIEHIFTLAGMLSLVSLTALEIILGVDNIVFIALVIQHLPKVKREYARRIGLTMALGLRVILLLSIAWVLSLTKPLLSFEEYDLSFSGKDLLLIAGGLFLIYKSTMSVREMFHNEEEQALRKSKGNLISTIIQIAVIDLVFSFDSVITAVGITQNIPIIIAAMAVAMIIMLIFTGFVSEFIFKHPTLKTLAISFILLIGVLLVGEGFGAHIPRGYVYFAMAFSCATETVNIILATKKSKKKSKA